MKRCRLRIALRTSGRAPRRRRRPGRPPAGPGTSRPLSCARRSGRQPGRAGRGLLPAVAPPSPGGQHIRGNHACTAGPPPPRRSWCRSRRCANLAPAAGRGLPRRLYKMAPKGMAAANDSSDPAMSGACAETEAATSAAAALRHRLVMRHPRSQGDRPPPWSACGGRMAAVSRITAAEPAQPLTAPASMRTNNTIRSALIGGTRPWAGSSHKRNAVPFRDRLHGHRAPETLPVDERKYRLRGQWNCSPTAIDPRPAAREASGGSAGRAPGGEADRQAPVLGGWGNFRPAKNGPLLDRP